MGIYEFIIICLRCFMFFSSIKSRQKLSWNKFGANYRCNLLQITVLVATVISFFGVVLPSNCFARSITFTLERAEEFLLSENVAIEGQVYKFDLYARDNDKYVIVLKNQPLDVNGKVRTFITPEIRFFNNIQMEDPHNKEIASKLDIQLKEVNIDYIKDWEPCGVRSKTSSRDFLKTIQLMIDDTKLVYSGVHTFSVVKKKYTRLKENAPGNKIMNDHALVESDTGTIIMPDVLAGGFRKIDPQTGKFIGKIIDARFSFSAVGLSCITLIESEKYIEASQLCKIACNNDEGMGCLFLGYLYKNGQGLMDQSEQQADFYYKKAKTLFEKACGLDNGDGCTGLGMLYNSGAGVQQSYKEAITYFEKGCNLYRGESCTGLGMLYYNGEGVQQSYQQAKTYFEKGCSMTDGQACLNAGVLYYSGEGVQQSYEQAKTYFEKGCSNGDSQSCLNVGVLYRDGQGVQQSYENAREYFATACYLGNHEGCDYLK